MKQLTNKNSISIYGAREHNLQNIDIKIPRNKLVVITELKDNALVDLAEKFNAEIIEHKEFIGGRYSVFSEAGMFPSALMGLNIGKFKNLKRYSNKNLISKKELTNQKH